MASLHQWKKYNIAYDRVWDYRVSNLNVENSDHRKIIFLGRKTSTDFIFHKEDRGRQGQFELINNRDTGSLSAGDTIYITDSELGFSGNDINGLVLNKDLEYNSTMEEYVAYYGSTYSSFREGKSYEPYVKYSTPKQGSYVGLVQGQEGAFPQNGQKDGFWYVYDKALNASPEISGSDLDLGSKDSDFTIDYVVSDSDGDVVTVDILVDDVVKVEEKSVPLGVNQKYLVKLDEFSLGDHKIEIRARDSKGAEASSRTYFFSKANTAPKISGSDTDLGNKSTGFTISYRVDDKDADSVSVRISLDDKEMSSISDAQGKDLRFTLDDSKVRELEIGSTYTITIKADDGKGGVAYRRYSFTKVNTPPIISGVDTDLGKVKEPVTIKFSVSDVEKDKIYFSLLLDGKEVMSQEGAEDSKEYSYKIDHDTFIRLPYGKHELKLLAWDDENLDKKAVRKFSFERISGGLDVEVKLAEYDTQPKKIVAVPHGDFIDTKTFQVLACNNYLDAKPTWEDITNMSKIARAFSFTNTTKTAGKWALGVRVIIENGKADISSILRGIKGGIE